MPSAEEIEQSVNTAIAELDLRQIAMFSRMTSAEKGRLLGNLVDSLKKLAFATERHLNPDLPDEEIHIRAVKRWMRMSEWEPAERERFLAWLRDRLGRETAFKLLNR